jgi:hypothetical protein
MVATLSYVNCGSLPAEEAGRCAPLRNACAGKSLEKWPRTIKIGGSSCRSSQHP